MIRIFFKKSCLCFLAFIAVQIFSYFSYAEEATEEEFTAFDIYLADSYRGIAAVKFSEDSFTFDNIDDVISLLPVIEDKTKIKALLEGTIPLQKELENVGSIKFDINVFKVVIVLNAEFLKSKTINNEQEVVKLEAKRAMRQDLRLTHLETENSTNAVNGLTYLSLGKPWLKADYFFSDNQESFVREGSANMLWGNYKLTGGIIKNSSHRLTPNVDLLGGSLTSSLHNFSDDNNARGSYFQVFIPSKSTVEFFRNSQLIDRQYLDYGLQEIDTNRFPDGSYYVDIVIHEFAGTTSNQRLFYTKSGLLAPRGHPVISLEGGVIRNQLQTLDIPVGSASLNWRVLKSAQIELASFDSSTYQVHTAGLRLLHNGYNLGSTLGIDNKNTKSYSIDFSGNLLSLDFGLTYERSRFVRFEEQKKITIPQKFIDILVDDTNSLPGEEEYNEVMNVYLSKNIYDIDFRFQGVKSMQNKKNTYSYGPSITYSFHKNPTNQWMFQFSYLRNDLGDNFLFLVGYQHSFDEYVYETSGTARASKGQNASSLTNALSYDSIDPKSSIGTRARFQNDTVGSNNDIASNSSIQVEHGTPKFGLASFGQNAVNQKGIAKPSLGISANTSLIVLENGKTVLAPSSLGESLFVLTLDTNSPDVEMEILLDGNVSSKIKGQGTIVMGVTPYKKYRAAIRPAPNSVLADYDSSIHEFSLFPGDIAQADFSADKVFVAMGTVVDVENKPIKLKRVKGPKASVLTDNMGLFQLEITGPQTMHIESNSVICSFDIPDVGVVEYFHDYGTLICK